MLLVLSQILLLYLLLTLLPLLVLLSSLLFTLIFSTTTTDVHSNTTISVTAITVSANARYICPSNILTINVDFYYYYL